MIAYFNMKSNYGVETVDELNSKDFNTYKEFREELIRLRKEYRFAGMDVYTSQRCTNEWKNNN